MHKFAVILSQVSIAFVGFTSSMRGAHAQEPGTNMTVPPPAQAPVLSTQDSFHNPAQAPTPDYGREPVIDPSTTRKTFPNRPLLVTGTLLLGGTYGASAIVAATSDRTEDEKLYYPVVGPWMDLHERDCGLDSCNDKTSHQVLLIGSGVLQGVGALTMLLSLVIPEKTTRSWYLIGNEKLTFAPRLNPAMAGLSAVGRF